MRQKMKFCVCVCDDKGLKSQAVKGDIICTGDGGVCNIWDSSFGYASLVTSHMSRHFNKVSWHLGHEDKLKSVFNRRDDECQDSEPEVFMLCWKDRGYSLVSGEIRVEHSRKKKKKKLAGDRLSKESERNKTLTFTLKDVCGVIYRAYLKTKLSPLS